MRHYEIVNKITGEVVMRVEALGTVEETRNGVTETDFIGDINVGILHMPSWPNYEIREVD